MKWGGLACCVIAFGLSGFAWADDYQSWHKKGVLAVKTRAYEKALAAFKKAVEADPNNPNGYFNAGNVARHLGRCRDALLYFRGFLYLAPGGEEASIARTGLKECAKRVSTGTVVVKSEPTGAEVFVDGVLVGATTLTDLVLPVGEISVSFRHPDCEPYEQKVKVGQGQPTIVSATLPLKPAFGFLKVLTVPEEGVTVYLDEKEVGVTPIEPIKLPTGKVFLRLEKPGYDRWIRAVVIEKDKTHTVEARLEQVQDKTGQERQR